MAFVGGQKSVPSKRVSALFSEEVPIQALHWLLTLIHYQEHFSTLGFGSSHDFSKYGKEQHHFSVEVMSSPRAPLSDYNVER